MNTVVFYPSTVAAGNRTTAIVSTRGADWLQLQLDIQRITTSGISVAIAESDDRANWTPLGISETIMSIGSTTLSQSNVARAYVRIVYDALGNPGGAAACGVVIRIERT